MVHFGDHITLDGYGGSVESLNDKQKVLSCLTSLCAKLEMHPLIEPVIIEAPDNDLKDPGGWSGFVIIAESHISIHTFPKRRFISADVYTCKNGLDEQLISEYFKAAFDLQDIETHFIERGQKYPSHNLVQ